VPLRHGHAISIDMAYSATLANLRGLLSDEEHRRLLNLFSKAGLTMDHHQFDENLLEKGTKAILGTRDGLLRAAVPSPLGSCVFLNDVSQDDLFEALRKHKEVMGGYPRNGEGIDAFVDASDTGYTVNGENVKATTTRSEGLKKLHVLNDDVSGTNGSNGTKTNSTHANGSGTAKINGVKASVKHASSPEGVDGMQNGVQNTFVTGGFK
jgi:3-dehydroquinate synthase